MNVMPETFSFVKPSKRNKPMSDFFADFLYNKFTETEDTFSPRGIRLKASTFEDAVAMLSIIQSLDRGYSLERISVKPTRGMEYKTVGEWK